MLSDAETPSLVLRITPYELLKAAVYLARIVV